MSKLKLTKRNEIFNQTSVNSIVESRYDLSKCSSGTFQMGALYPIYCRNDIVPGDKFKLSCVPFIRFLPLVSPALTNVDVDVRYFFVPRRLLWSQWKNFFSPSSADDVALIEPFIYNRERNGKIVSLYNTTQSIYDYMGCASISYSKTNTDGVIYGNPTWIPDSDNPTPFGSDYFGFAAPIKDVSQLDDVDLGFHNSTPLKYSAYPFLAYNAIYNEYFRDENLQPEGLSHVTTGGNHHGYQFYLRRVSWQKDYFSSALPWVTQAVFNTPTINNGDTIEVLREASALTRWLELQAIGGHRYQESILSHFGIRVPDEAAQVPIYLGGGRVPVQIGSVDQTSPFENPDTSEIIPLANLGGKGTASGNLFVDRFEFKEHGTILGVMCIRPHALYADVNPKDILALDSRHDYYYPEFANLGDEGIINDELNPGWSSFTNGNDEFGYQMRYASYRTSFDQVHGLLRPGESLESWTQARSWRDKYHNPDAGSLVLEGDSISNGFITCRPSNRIFAYKEFADNLVGEITTLVDAVRPLPNYVDPKID